MVCSAWPCLPRTSRYYTVNVMNESGCLPASRAGDPYGEYCFIVMFQLLVAVTEMTRLDIICKLC